jgi:hypothetical protein
MGEKAISVHPELVEGCVATPFMLRHAQHERLSLQHPYNYKLISTLPCIGQDPFRIPGLEIFWLAGLKRESPSETKMLGHKQLVINLSHTFDVGNGLLAISLFHGGADGTPQDHLSSFDLDVNVPDLHPQNP